MENWKSIRQDVLVNGISQRAACAKYKLGWHTLKKSAYVAACVALGLMVVALVFGIGAWCQTRQVRLALNESERRIDLTKLREAQLAWDNNNLELVEQYLDDVKPEHRSTIVHQTKYPCFAWNYLKRQSLGGLFSLYGYTSLVCSVAFSPDGQWIVTGLGDMTARVWDARTGRSLGPPFQGHIDSVTSVAFSPDGQWIVTRSWDKTARVCDARTGQSLIELQGHTGGVSSVAFSPDGQRIVTGSRDQTARVWDARTGHSSIELQGHTQSVSDVAFSPDGQWIVAYDVTDTARVWNATTGALIPDANNPPDTLPEGQISRDQKFLWLPRFKKVLVIPLAITPEDQAERKARTCPRPDLHRMEAKRLEALEHKTEAEQFAAQVQRALEQQALGQEKVDAGKPEEAQPFFDKANQLWPKPVPMEPPPVAAPAVTPPPPPEPTRIP